jgi:hypothetical protein
MGVAIVGMVLQTHEGLEQVPERVLPTRNRREHGLSVDGRSFDEVADEAEGALGFALTCLPGQHRRRTVECRTQLLQEARLADPRLAGHHDTHRAVRADRGREVLQLDQWGLTADHRRNQRGTLSGHGPRYYGSATSAAVRPPR